MAVDGEAVFAANNEDYWLDATPLVWVTPAAAPEHARVTWGLAESKLSPAFAQGGMNDAGLFFDAAVTPEGDTPRLKSRGKAPSNMGDAMLAANATVAEAIAWLEQYDLRLLRASHLLLADATGDGAVVELHQGAVKVFRRQQGNYVGATNFSFADPARGNYPCPRFAKIDNYFKEHQGPVNGAALRSLLQSVAVAPAIDAKTGRQGGTLYSNLCELKAKTIAFYPANAFDRGRSFRLEGLLARGASKYRLDELLSLRE